MIQRNDSKDFVWWLTRVMVVLFASSPVWLLLASIYVNHIYCPDLTPKQLIGNLKNSYMKFEFGCPEELGSSSYEVKVSEYSVTTNDTERSFVFPMCKWAFQEYREDLARGAIGGVLETYWQSDYEIFVLIEYGGSVEDVKKECEYYYNSYCEKKLIK